jgi:apolipoprotein D and lipocalin family protein
MERLVGWFLDRKTALAFVAGFLMTACSTAPPLGVHPVAPFAVDRYLGTWYEIARLDHRFEEGLTDIQATYSLESDGSVKVLNRGKQVSNGQWREAVGKALFTGKRDEGSLKVSFFGPFYGGYHVAALDPDYRWSLVVGPDRDYFWILSRDPHLSPALRDQLIHRAQTLGIATDRLIWTPQQGKDSKNP